MENRDERGLKGRHCFLSVLFLIRLLQPGMCFFNRRGGEGCSTLLHAPALACLLACLLACRLEASHRLSREKKRTTWQKFVQGKARERHRQRETRCGRCTGQAKRKSVIIIGFWLPAEASTGRPAGWERVSFQVGRIEWPRSCTRASDSIARTTNLIALVRKERVRVNLEQTKPAGLKRQNGLP